MLSEDSELTDLSSLDDDVTKPASTKKGTAGKQKKEGYRLRNVLKPGRTTQYTAKALYDQIHQNDIELDPEYQRDVVWSDAKQIGLIDSIFRNFYVPPIIFAVTTEDDGTEKRVCIDGKQRLTSIQKFIGGIIPHRDPFTNEKLWFIDSHTGPKRKLLPPQYKTLFQNKQIVCIEYSDLPGDLEREVFQRVQMGMALTTAEKLQAISGPWPVFVREIMQQYHTGTDGIANNVDLEKTRARDFQNVAHALFCIDNLPAHVQGTTLQIEKWLQLEDGPSDDTRAKIHDVFRIYKDIANHKQLKSPLKKPLRVAPAEFIMTAVLIAVHKNTHSPAQLSQGIGILRIKTRAEHADVRTNAKVFKTMFNIISKDVKLSALNPNSGQAVAGTKSAAGIVSKSMKRKREESSEEDSTDEDLGDDEVEYKPRTGKNRIPPVQSPTTSRPHFSGQVSSTTSRVKIEETADNLPVSHNAQASPAVNPPQMNQSGLDRVRAAKLQAAAIVSGTWSGPSPPTSAPTFVSRQLPARPLPSAPSVPPSSSLEAVMMSQASHQSYLPAPAPYPTPPLNTAPTYGGSPNNPQRPPAIPIPIFSNGHNHQQVPPDPSHTTAHPPNDGYRRHGSPRSSRDERSEGGYRDYDDHRDREPSRTYRERDRDLRDLERDRERERERDYSYSRNPYNSRGASYKSRDSTWDRRGSGYKDR